MNKTIFLILIIFFGLGLKARNLDSLYQVWQDKSNNDTVRVGAYHDYVWYGYLYNKPDTAFILANKLIQYASNENFPNAKVKALNIQATSFWFKGQYDSALQYYTQNIQVIQQIDDQKSLATTLNNIGLISQIQGNHPQALEYFNNSLKIREQLGDDFGIASTLQNMGNINTLQEDYPKALAYIKRSLRIFEKIKNKRGIAGCLTNIGLIYQYQEEYEKALGYHQRSLKIDQEAGYKNGMANAIGNIGYINSKQGYFSEALDYYNQCLKIQEEIGNQMGMATSFNNIGEIYQKQGHYAKSIEYCLKANALAKSIGVLEPQKNASAHLYLSYKGLGNTAKSLEYHEQYMALHDSLQNTENTKKLTQLEMQYSFDKKEAETQLEQEKKDALAVKELQHQRLLRNGFIGGFILVLLFAGVFFKQRNRIGKEKAVSEELLLNILPEEVAVELKAKGHAEAQLIDQVTVVFTDFKGFTSLSEQLTPKELVQDLHDCFSKFDEVCENYGIEKIKTIGDAYMAAGGLPSPNSTHAKDVVNAALEMVAIVEHGKQQKIAQGQPFFEVRIGVHTGPVVAGIVGVKKFQYDIWGDTVNTASRMESSGAVGKVNISTSTYQLLNEDIDYSFESRGKIQAKGKGELEMYFVNKA